MLLSFGSQRVPPSALSWPTRAQRGNRDHTATWQQVSPGSAARGSMLGVLLLHGRDQDQVEGQRQWQRGVDTDASSCPGSLSALACELFIRKPAGSSTSALIFNSPNAGQFSAESLSIIHVSKTIFVFSACINKLWSHTQHAICWKVPRRGWLAQGGLSRGLKGASGSSSKAEWRQAHHVSPR